MQYIESGSVRGASGNRCPYRESKGTGVPEHRGGGERLSFSWPGGSQGLGLSRQKDS
jgi:hypothetical protein